MSDEKQETRADILAVMRRGLDKSWHEIDREWLRGLPDRLEAAWKRDEERAVEHATRHAEAVARDNCRDCVHNPRGKNYEGGNAAAMREALVQCELFLGNVSKHGHPTLNPGDKCTACDGVDELRGMVVRALSKPPRQCDVGTPEEQAKRFNDFCSTHTCNKCVVYDKMAHSFNDGIPERAFSCRLVFSQLPYEAEEGATK